MNCKPGDLAIVVIGMWPDWIGRIVKVLQVSRYYSGSWEIEWCGSIPESIQPPEALCSVKDYDLKPVSGLPMKEETGHNIKEPA